jgi:hypothetical protein
LPVADDDHILRREMGFTRAEFMRILPSALHGYSHAIEGDSIRVDIDDSRLSISLGEERVRKIALLQLPYMEVVFDYREVDAQAFRTFLKQFDLYFRKGGG